MQMIDKTKCPKCGAASFRISRIEMYISSRVVKYRCIDCSHEHREYETPYALNNKIIFMRSRNFSIREIANQLKIPRQLVMEVWGEYCRGGN